MKKKRTCVRIRGERQWTRWCEEPKPRNCTSLPPLQMEALASSSSSDSDGSDHVSLDEAYRRLPLLYFSLMLIWFLSVCSWTFNTCKTRHFQVPPNSSIIFLFHIPIWVKEIFHFWCLNWKFTAYFTVWSCSLYSFFHGFSFKPLVIWNLRLIENLSLFNDVSGPLGSFVVITEYLICSSIFLILVSERLNFYFLLLSVCNFFGD